MGGSYEDIQNQPATWFIDPPYQKMGFYYKHKDIDYNHLSEWCLSRDGQIIVCENEGADWLPFEPLCNLYGQRRQSRESVYFGVGHLVQPPGKNPER